MRSYLGKDAFFLKMKKKGRQQEVLDNLDNYTKEQIELLDGPHFPRWVKDALLRLKENDRSATTAYDIAERMNQYHKEHYDSLELQGMQKNLHGIRRT